MNAPLVTVVVSCYNHAAYIEACIRSIVEQTYPAIELLVYDDGSSDNSATVLQELAEHHGFSFTAQRNIGYTKTLNQALSRARGKYFCAVGSDDILFPHKIADQVALMEWDEDIAACGGNVIVIDGAGTIVSRGQKFHQDRELVFDDLFENRKPGINTPSAMFRTEALRAVGGYREDLRLEDFALWLSLAHAGCKLYGMNALSIYYRKHAANTSKDIRMMYEEISRILLEYREEKAFAPVFLAHKYSYFLRASKSGERRLAWEILKEIPFAQYNAKVLKGLLYLVLRR